ncbi:hypothetical protein [Oligosphaera ethanolica]|uniref:Uncharacterized protein n=1 Tax=Oligosphaera ethanolica TaxID=760260 RepID=A0AAE3VGH4_9BACT|nr:hypothetical protein [Oligosphaera ethanolica]MDQ0290099.1 hypothetical protein [Oligosphaera ethanolica]
MKHQKTSGMLRGAWLVLLLIFVSGGLHAWQVDVFVNGSTEGATMSFGEGEADMKPMPPFSGMYGVVDVYLANPDKVYPAGISAAIQDFYNRLSVDIKASATRVDNRWVLVAGSNARLTWTAVEGAIPADFNIAWTEKGENKVEAVVAGATFSVKAGITYTLGVGVGTADIQTDPNNPNQMVGKDEQGNLEPAIITLTMPSVAAVTSYTISINLNAGTTLLAFPVYEAGVLTKYKANNGTEILPAGIAAAAAWIIEVVAPGYDVALAWDVTDPNVLIATLTKNNTRADGDWLLSAQPTKTGIAPLSANTTLTKVDGTDPTAEELLGNLIAIIQQLGTLDFDSNGVVDLDDATYLYNYAAGGMDPYATAEDLMAFTTAEATVAAAQTALDFFRNNLSELYFDGTDEQVGVLLDNATYFYNFASGNFDEYATGADLKAFSTAAATDALAEEALATMREFLENAR